MGQPTRRAVDGPQLGKSPLEPFCGELPDVFGPGETAQRVRAQIDNRQVDVERVGGQLVGRRRHEDLTAVGKADDPGGPVQRGTRPVVPARLGIASVDSGITVCEKMRPK